MSIASKIVSFKKGALIFSEGDSSDVAYIIDKGKVEVFIANGDTEVSVSTLDQGQIFGEMGVIDESPRSASARALTDCVLSLVKKEQLQERITSSDPVVRLVIRRLLSRVRSNLKLSVDDEADQQGASQDMSQALGFSANTNKDDEDVVEKIRFEQDLVSALENEEFVLHFQPIIDLKDERLCGFEALVRWQSPSRGLVRPDLFLGVAEETSLIVPLGQWILQKACESFTEIREKYSDVTGDEPDLFMSINVSAKQVSDPEFFKVLEKSIKSDGLRPGDLKLEITESLYAESKSVTSWIEQCKRVGVLIALDDFGTGYSSLSYLSSMNIDNLKIDRSFVNLLADDPSTQVIVKAIIQMAKGLRKPIIAEGIETEEQKLLLKALGCQYGQGYLFGKPIPLDELIKTWIEVDQANKKAA